MPLTVNCKGCNKDFVVEDGELAFLQGKFGSDYKPPGRCKPCREEKRAKFGHPQRPQAVSAAPQSVAPARDADENRQPNGKKKRRNRGRDEYSDY